MSLRFSRSVPGRALAVLAGAFAIVASRTAVFADITVTIGATDAIFLAGRSDVTIAPPGPAPSGYPLVRNGYGPFVESFPKMVPVTGGTAYQFSATGTEIFDSPNNVITVGPDGTASSSINALAGISGYNGPKGAILGLFLDGANPLNTAAPPALAYSTNFTALSPILGQVFFIGDGLSGTAGGTRQTFTSPSGATRLFFGFADGYVFSGAPGMYDDNVGSSVVTVTTVPEPWSATLLMAGGVLLLTRRGSARHRLFEECRMADEAAL